MPKTILTATSRLLGVGMVEAEANEAFDLSASRLWKGMLDMCEMSNLGE